MLFIKYVLMFLWGLVGVMWHMMVHARTHGKKKLRDMVQFYADDYIWPISSLLLWSGFFALWVSAIHWLPFVDHVIVAWINKKLIALFGEGASIGSIMFLRSMKLGGLFVVFGFVVDSLTGNSRAQWLARKLGIMPAEQTQNQGV